ncbi:hypothetical protein FC68_GL001603 [Companilactobacillus farciminis KCTC 3681 = DSM 20184]|nr:hypothetical protein FC68_GL001603 [Companilactobacillus farciminis KCTC 3681 = DSM 20184]
MNNLKFVAVGIIGSIIGTFIANRLVSHLNISFMKTLIYIFIGLSGLYYITMAL